MTVTNRAGLFESTRADGEEKFLRNPFNKNPESRLYHTGDVAKYRADGSIEFLGRCDNQVKFRGYRIELGEIESVLNQHPAVKDAVVVVRRDVTEEESRADNSKSEIENPKLTPRLVAYVVPNEEQASINELRGVLKKNLPEYMMPSSFVVLEVLPLTSNGKADRNKLPPPDGTRPPLTREFVPPRTEIEELIIQTWREVLKIEDLGIHDNFFELGGHSLLATQIVARLQEAFNKNVPIRVLFDAPTIAELAQEVETIVHDGCGPDLPPIVPIPRVRPMPLSMNQEHLWHLDRIMPGTHFFNMPFVYQLSGDLNVKALERTVKEIVRRHEALRTIFREVEGKLVQIVKDGSDFQLQITELRGRSQDDASQASAEHILKERSVPFNLATAPPVRVRLLRLTERVSLFLVTMHHIISDYWSMRVFSGELTNSFGVREGKPIAITGTKNPIWGPSLWSRRLLDDGHFHDQGIYWKKQISAVQIRINTRPPKGIASFCPNTLVSPSISVWAY